MGVPAIVGTCSLCSGAVLFDPATGKVCRSCGAKAFSPFGPVIEMRPAPQATPSSWVKLDKLVNRDDSAKHVCCTHCGTTSAQHDTTCPNGTTTNGGPRNG